jgi:hypothetical protein
MTTATPSANFKIRPRHVLFMLPIITILTLIAWTWLNDQRQSNDDVDTIKIVVDRLPHSLKPDRFTDQMAQRYFPLLYKNLGQAIQTAANHNTKPDAAFTINRMNRLIDIRYFNDSIHSCLLNYQKFAPQLGFQKITKTKQNLQIQFDERFFYVESWFQRLPVFQTINHEWCRFDQAAISNAQYKIQSFTAYDLWLEPDFTDKQSQTKQPAPPKLHFHVIADEYSMFIRLLRKQFDVCFNSLGLSKTAMIRDRMADHFQVIKSTGHHLSFLGFTGRNQFVRKAENRKLIGQQINTQGWVKGRGFGFLAPLLPKNNQQADLPKHVEKNIELTFLTTQQREGFEIGEWLAWQLKPLSIQLKILQLDSAAYQHALRNNLADLFVSRFFRQSESDSLFHWLYTKSPRAVFAGVNPALDQQMLTHGAAWSDVQTAVLDQQLLVPLFVWHHGLVVSKNIKWRARLNELLIDDSYSFLLNAIKTR